MTEYPTFLKEQERQHAIETAKVLNERFRAGGSIWEEDTLRKIRSLPKPIVVDFNGVLVNQSRPWVPNPEANGFIKDLRTVGTVIILTVARRDWDLRHRALQDFGLFHEGTVLMTAENYNYPPRETEELTRRQAEEIDRFSKLKAQDSNAWSFGGKRIGHIFQKPFDVPLIDDDDYNTDDNLGVLGIEVESFDPEVRNIYMGGLTLQEAAGIVIRHYESPFLNTLVTLPGYEKRGSEYKTIAILKRQSRKSNQDAKRLFAEYENCTL